jgi:hypothetical protein
LVSSVKNDECTIYITTKRGYTQRYRKEKNGWTQTNPNGKVRPLTAEQLLSHILPSLAGVGPLSVRVEPDRQKKEAMT